MNHVTLGLDVPSLFASIYKATGRLPRALGDTCHFLIPVHCHALRFFGAVPGTPAICSRLMQDGQPILVFPGGAREVLRKCGDAPYSLFWGGRMGFARLAVQHGYTIVPVASVGVEDNVRVVLDLDISWFMRLVGDKRRDVSLPLVCPRLPLSTSLQRLYFYFGQPINCDTTEYSLDPTNPRHHSSVRDVTRSRLLLMLEVLQRTGSQDPLRTVAASITASLGHHRGHCCCYFHWAGGCSDKLS